MRELKYHKTAKARNKTRHIINAERVKLHVTTGDQVRVVRGDDKGKEGKVLRVYRKTGRVVIEGVNIVRRHLKQGRARQAGIVEIEAPLHVSNVMLFCASCESPTRVGFREDAAGKKERYCKKCDASIPSPQRTRNER